MRDSSLVRIVDLELKLEELLGRRVDVLTLEDVGANPVLLAEAVAEGRTIGTCASTERLDDLPAERRLPQQ